MKKSTLIIICLLLVAYNSFSQITLQHVYTMNPPDRFVKLNLSGLKYVAMHDSALTMNYFNLYNPDHSLFKTINIPQFPGKEAIRISYISETLFDTDTLVEYLASYYNFGGIHESAVRVCNENGVILLERDTAIIGTEMGMLDLGMGGQIIFPNGAETKLIINKGISSGGPYETEIYNLPGQVACLECSNGVISGLIEQPNMFSSQKSSLAYPNPFTDYVKIKCSLPEKFNHAYLNLFDITGKLIKKKEIDKTYNEIYISDAEIKQGAYIYQIVVDDKEISSNKIIKL